MARYIGGVKGRKGPGVTRLGAATTGITTEADGWNVGVYVHGRPNPAATDHDEFTITLDGGSMGEADAFCLGDLRETPSGRIFVLTPAAVAALGAETDTIRLKD